jgi:DsbC/DsbD-like thiol-disulfide interchange protein
MMTAARLTIAAILLFGHGVLSAPAWAQDASDWDTQPHTAVRLIAGATSKTSKPPILLAGVEIKLDAGWHTYWHDPGDTGVPPTFDFSGSDNVKSATVLWPAPQRFSDGAGGTSIGYVDHVILPVQVAPMDAAKPTLLHLKLGYAICGNLCIPAEAKLQLALNGNGAEDGAIEKAETRVPRRVPLGANSGPNNALAILAVHRIAGASRDHVVVDVAAPAGVPVDLLVEGPTPDWSLPQPEPKGDSNGETRQFTFDLDGLPSDTHAIGALLTFTAVSPDDSIEVQAHLD